MGFWFISRSNSTKDLVLITNVEQNKFYNKLKNELNFENDKRIKFVGTVYDADYKVEDDNK